MKTLVKTLVYVLFGALWSVIYLYVPLENNGGALAKMVCSWLLGAGYVIALVEIDNKKDWKKFTLTSSKKTCLKN